MSATDESVMSKEIRRLGWKAIAAMSLNRVIGKDGKLPWSIPGDLQWVKECTYGQAIAMGRKTFESMGSPLPGRLNIVLSRSEFHHPGCVHLRSLDELKSCQCERTVWIFGGAALYRDALPWTSELLLTVVRREVEGDTYFPAFEDDFLMREIVREESDFEIRRYVNRKIVPDSD